MTEPKVDDDPRRQAALNSLGEAIKSFDQSIPVEYPASDRDLVMGIYLYEGIDKILPFVESLRSVGAFRGEVALFVNPRAKALARYLEGHGITAIPFNLAENPLGEVSNGRWFAYFDFLRAKIARGQFYRNILMTDVRDVVFQKPLFGRPCEDIEFHLEAPTPLIGDCPTMSVWVERVLGRDRLAKMAGERTVCAGTVSGRMAGVMRYLARLQLAMIETPPAIRTMWGCDQVLHNALLYEDRAPGAVAVENFTRVATLANIAPDSLQCDAGGAVISPDGTISEIAHQWDRHPRMTRKIVWLARWRYLRSSSRLAPLLRR